MIWKLNSSVAKRENEIGKFGHTIALLGEKIMSGTDFWYERRRWWDNPKEWIESSMAKLKFIRSLNK
jgi:hypothetical protein